MEHSYRESTTAWSEVLRSLQERGLVAAGGWRWREHRRDAVCTRLRDLRQTPAAACLERDWEDFVTFHDFPKEHWLHLRNSNPIGSIFSGVRLRTHASKR